ncbi:hypothetical protein AMTRI_Chr04g251910 [Amborella trichopoda]
MVPSPFLINSGDLVGHNSERFAGKSLISRVERGRKREGFKGTRGLGIRVIIWGDLLRIAAKGTRKKGQFHQYGDGVPEVAERGSGLLFSLSLSASRESESMGFHILSRTPFIHPRKANQ